MRSADAVLFLGNGPGRVSSEEFSWREVLAKLTDLTGGKVAVELKPLPLVFEEMVFRRVREETAMISGRYQPSIESDLKRYVAGLVNKMRPNRLHARIVSAGFRHILTTNYDYCLEKAETDRLPETTVTALVADHAVEERKHNLFRRYRVSTQRGETFVWHIHGEARVPRSLVLGYGQYVSHLGRIISYLTHPNDARRSIGDSISSPLLSGDTRFESSGRPYSWLDMFIERDVYILGLSLDFSEIAL